MQSVCVTTELSSRDGGSARNCEAKIRLSRLPACRKSCDCLVGARDSRKGLQDFDPFESEILGGALQSGRTVFCRKTDGTGAIRISGSHQLWRQ